MKLIRLALLFPLLLACSASAADPDMDLVKRWLTKQAGAKAVAIDFTQTRELRSLKRPIEVEGKLWFKAPGSFRWELGQPARTIALQSAGDDMLVVEPAKKRAKRFTKESLLEKGRGRGVGFLGAGLPRGIEAFTAQFTITATQRKGELYHIEARLNNKRAALVLRKIVFFVDAGSLESRGFYLRFRDASSITTTFNKIVKNPSIPTSTFTFDLTGFDVKGGQTEQPDA